MDLSVTRYPWHMTVKVKVEMWEVKSRQIDRWIVTSHHNQSVGWFDLLFSFCWVKGWFGLPDSPVLPCLPCLPLPNVAELRGGIGTARHGTVD